MWKQTCNYDWQQYKSYPSQIVPGTHQKRWYGFAKRNPVWPEGKKSDKPEQGKNEKKEDKEVCHP